MTNKGLSIELETMGPSYIKSRGIYEREERPAVPHCVIVVLNCYEESDQYVMALELMVPGISEFPGKVFTRVTTAPFTIFPEYETKRQSLFISRNGSDMEDDKEEEEELRFCVDMTHRTNLHNDEDNEQGDSWDSDLDKALLRIIMEPGDISGVNPGTSDSLVIRRRNNNNICRGHSSVKVTMHDPNGSPTHDIFVVFCVRLDYNLNIAVLDSTNKKDFNGWFIYNEFCHRDERRDKMVRWFETSLGSIGLHVSIKHTPAFGVYNLYSVEIAFENFLRRT
jgi:hypothetical protein